MVILRNPLSFTSIPVIFFICTVYVATLLPLFLVDFRISPPPGDKSLAPGLNLTEAWTDLQVLSNGFHPYNSRRNDEVRDWLLHRIKNILNKGNTTFDTCHNVTSQSTGELHRNLTLSPVVIFDDLQTNLSFSWSARGSIHVYFEGTNIIVYIRGTQEDEQSDWWVNSKNGSADGYRGIGGVLVNAHYDSVSTGYGATDDGVGVVSILQLISYFTQEGQRPNRGIVALFNNGEEDYLNGAYAFAQHPVAKFPRVFLNLEGAGAGGRAALFRSTDTEVTRFYKNTKHPFGTVISADGFKRGLVKSETDYAVFTKELGLRGLDVAFIGPRSRYHTAEDDVRDTSKRAVWHMLSAALNTVKSMSNDLSDEFEKDNGKSSQLSSGTVPVWFDVYGRAFFLSRLRSLFAISVTALVVSPIFLIILMASLKSFNRWYLFTRGKHGRLQDRGNKSIAIEGLRGFFRYPFAFIVATGAVVGEAFLIARCNPQIAQSNPYTIWATMLSTWFFVIWFLLRGAARMRPTDFDRVYALLWIYIIFFILLTAATILENNFQISGVYFVVFYFLASFAALSVAYVELFALPPMSQYESGNVQQPSLDTSGTTQTDAVDNMHHNEQDDVTESTSLIDNEGHQSFARYGAGVHNPDETESGSHTSNQLTDHAADEQNCKNHLPAFLWIIEFLLLAPINIILVGQIGLFVTSALPQTLSDGSSPLVLYLDFAILSVLLLIPLSAFINRITSPLASLVLLLLASTLCYSLLAFPFSRDARLKVRFGQHINLDNGLNTVYIAGLRDYIQPVIASLPSASGQEVDCDSRPVGFRTYAGLATCGFSGLSPDVLKDYSKKMSLTEGLFEGWLSYSINKTLGSNEATIQLQGINTRACRLYFDRPVNHVHVINSRNAKSELHPEIREATSMQEVNYRLDSEINQVRLWSREWNGSWEINVSWAAHKQEEGWRNNLTHLEGMVACLWSDVNQRGTIPAYDEAERFLPVWAGMTKMDDGLVIGSKRFSI